MSAILTRSRDDNKLLLVFWFSFLLISYLTALPSSSFEKQERVELEGHS